MQQMKTWSKLPAGEVEEKSPPPFFQNGSFTRHVSCVCEGGEAKGKGRIGPRNHPGERASMYVGARRVSIYCTLLL